MKELANAHKKATRLRPAFETRTMAKRSHKALLPARKRNAQENEIAEKCSEPKKMKNVKSEKAKKAKINDKSVSARRNTGQLDLSISECGFQWNNLQNEQPVDSSSDSEDEVETTNEKETKKLTSTERRDAERRRERQVREREEALNSRQMPQTDHEFDRLLLANPNNSLVWVNFMVYYLQVTDIEKARSVAKRALKNINFREEHERLNIWMAWLNLESRFGSVESVEAVFQEATKTSNAEKICQHMLTLHLSAARHDEIEKIVNLMLTKFKQNFDTWIRCTAITLEIGLKEKARHIMQRALQSLPEHKHVDLTVRFAVLESKFGDKEQSQTLFESILAKHKNRTDIWSSYVDSLVKSGEIETARKVLERAVAESFAVKKMKVLFKKYISFEKTHGSCEQVARVQQLAEEYAKER